MYAHPLHIEIYRTAAFHLCSFHVFLAVVYKSKEQGKDQESIQWRTTPSTGHHMIK